MGNIAWTEESAHWLRDIYDYIAPDSPEAAQKVVTGIYERVQILAKCPKIGHLYRVEPDSEIRILLYGHYRIAYLLGKDRRVEILGVFHGALVQHGKNDHSVTATGKKIRLDGRLFSV